MTPARFLLIVIAAISCSATAGYIAYNTSSTIVDGKLNVHVVPHTHDDVGWLKTVDQYYVGSNNSIQIACVQNVLDSLIPELALDKNRKFIYVEQAFFSRWWRQQNDVLKKLVKELVDSGQLEFVNGGMCMHDEAAVHYIDMIDQTTLGHLFIKKHFGQTPRIGWQIDPFGHAAVQSYLLGAEVGFDAIYFSRIDYQDRIKRKQLKKLEVVWRGSKTLGSSADIFTGIFPENYGPPPGGFYFEINDADPVVQDDPLLFDYNVEERVNDFVAAAFAQANISRANHIMFTMGEDFEYQYAHSWFRQMDKLIHYVNLDGRVNALYSTPSIYTDAKHAANESWPLKTDDFFPYADRANGYWTGYFTSRPALKRYVRVMSAYHLAARQLEFFVGRNSAGPTTDILADALAIAQHHDAVSGTEKQHVANDYAKRLAIGYAEAEKVVEVSLACLTESDSSSGCSVPKVKFAQCPLLNISYCPSSEAELSNGKSLVVLVYNSLGWKRDDVIRIPVLSKYITVHDSEGKEIEAQLLPILNPLLELRSRYAKAYLGTSPNITPKYWLAFSVSIPPLGFNTYIISVSEKTKVAPRSTMLYVSRRSKESDIKVGPGELKLSFDANRGKLYCYSNSRSSLTIEMNQTYSYYSGDNGKGGDPQASGAYIFRPDDAFPIKPEGQISSTILRGPLLDEVHQQINPWIYQINLGIYIEDGENELSVLVDRSVGGSSIVDGQVELMLHRRLLFDDGRGVAEALNEVDCVDGTCQGLTVQGKIYLRFDPKGEGAKWRRSFGQEIYSPLLIAFAEQDEGNWENSHKGKFSAVAPSYSLPDNVALLTLQALEDGSTLLRLAHLYEAGEDKDLSVMARVELENMFPRKKISKIVETNLSANQEKSEMEKKKLKWKVEGEGSKANENILRGRPISTSDLVVELGPMEIRTFVIYFEYDARTTERKAVKMCGSESGWGGIPGAT